MGQKRSRNGCWTCRRRHQKCDETRPECLNCRIRGATCGGYDIHLDDFSMHRNGQMVSRVMRTGPRRQNKAAKPQEPRSEVGRHERDRTADLDTAAMSIGDNFISSGESQLHTDDSLVGITHSVIVSQLSMN
ncbi:hypothetical protein LB505_011142 [Fusarium chuoi]|nr:hypothetical protein LB505_011142 [Fusarium chuoi]